jgi:hypothetical protein
MFWMLFSLFWVIPRYLNFMYRRFGALCQIHLHRWCKLWQCSETSAHKIQPPGNHQKERKQHVLSYINVLCFRYTRLWVICDAAECERGRTQLLNIICEHSLRDRKIILCCGGRLPVKVSSYKRHYLKL